MESSEKRDYDKEAICIVKELKWTGPVYFKKDKEYSFSYAKYKKCLSVPDIQILRRIGKRNIFF